MANRGGNNNVVEREKKMEHGRAQARLSEDDMLRTGYVGKIADSDPVRLFNAQPAEPRHDDSSSQQQQRSGGGGGEDEPPSEYSSEPGVQRAKQGMHGGRQLGRQ